MHEGWKKKKKKGFIGQGKSGNRAKGKGEGKAGVVNHRLVC